MYEYIFWYILPKSEKQKTILSPKMSWYHHFLYYQHTHYKFSINIGSISFFSSSDTQQSHHLLGCGVTGINSLFNSCLSALHFSNLIYQDKSMTRIKLSLTLILLGSILTIPISLYLNTASPESSIKTGYISICTQSSKKFFNHLFYL